MTVMAAVALVLAFTAAAAPADVVDDGVPGLLTIEVDGTPFRPELGPGDRAGWAFTLRLDAPSDGSVVLDIRSAGALADHPQGLRIAIAECPAPWETSAGAEPVCPAEAGVLVPERPIAGATSPDGLPIGVLERNGARYLLATFSLPDDIPDALQGADAEFELRFAAAGDTETIGPEQPEAVATTGVAIAVPLLVAVALLAVGLVVRMRRAEQ